MWREVAEAESMKEVESKKEETTKIAVTKKKEKNKTKWSKDSALRISETMDPTAKKAELTSVGISIANHESKS